MYKPAMSLAALCLACSLVVAVQHAAGQEYTDAVPSWVKQTAGWWSDDLISNDEFLAAMRYLIQEGILVVDMDSMQTDTEAADTRICREAEDPVQTITWSFGSDDTSFGVNDTYTKWLETLGGQDAALEAVAAGFDAWTDLNPSLEFYWSEQPSACGYPHINVAVGRTPVYDGTAEGDSRVIAHGTETVYQTLTIYAVLGYACFDCLHDAPQIVLDDNWYRITHTPADVPLDAMSVRNVVAQGFGHILGLEHYYGDPLHLMGILYSKEVFCTPAGLSGHTFYTGRTFEYDDLGWTIPKVLFDPYGGDMPIDTSLHPPPYSVESVMYDRASGILYVTFNQEVLNIDLSGTRMVGSGSEESILKGADMTYHNNTAQITMSEQQTKKFDDIFCAYLHLSGEQHDTTYQSDTVIVEVIR